jgi:hypothetical protein
LPFEQQRQPDTFRAGDAGEVDANDAAALGVKVRRINQTRDSAEYQVTRQLPRSSNRGAVICLSACLPGGHGNSRIHMTFAHYSPSSFLPAAL